MFIVGAEPRPLIIFLSSYPDIVFYLLHSQSFVTHDEVKNYKSLLSYKYFVSGWVLEVAWKAYGDSQSPFVLVKGKVRHSYSTNKPPLYLWVIIKQSGAVLLGHCTCMAGLAETCSHVGVILHWVEAAVRINMSTTSTSKENSWLMPRAMDSTPFLELKNISFTANKSVAQSAESLPSPPPKPSAIEKENFFKELSKEQDKMPIILSVLSPYNASFITSDEHLPQLFCTFYDPINSEKSQSELLQLAADYKVEPTTIDKVKQLASITTDQSKSKFWFHYRAGWITASRLRQVTHTSVTKPSVSLIKSICYPDIHHFHNDATKWGCTHESDALIAYERRNVRRHQGFTTSRCGFL